MTSPAALTPSPPSVLASAAALRPRPASELVDAAFQLVRRHFVPLLAAAMVLWFPIVILQQLGSRLGDVGAFAAGAGGFLIGVGSLVWYAVGSAMLARVASDAYVGGGPRPGSALRTAIARTWDICVSSFVSWVVIAAGVFLISLIFGFAIASMPPSLTGRLWISLPILLTVLGLMLGWTGYFTAYYFAVPAACTIDGLDFSDALKRSRRLSEGQKRHILAAMCWPYLIASIPLIGLLVATAVFPGAFTMLLVVWHVLTVLALPLVGAVTAVVYTDARVRRDGFDLEMMAQALGTGEFAVPPVAAPAGASPVGSPGPSAAPRAGAT